MKRLTIAAVLVAMTSVVFGQSRGEQEIQAAEKAWADSYQACDMAAMGKILSNDLTLRVWVKTNGQWQVVNHQSTGLAAPHK